MDRRLALAGTWILALIGFVALAALAGTHDTFPGDVWLAQHFQDLDSRVISFMLDVPEELSDPPLILAVWAIATAAVTVTMQVVAEPVQPPPAQPMNVDPVLGVAVSVSIVP